MSHVAVHGVVGAYGFRVLLIISLLGVSAVRSGAQDILLHVSHTASSRVFTEPSSRDAMTRSGSNDLGPLFSTGAAVRVRVTGDLAAEASFEVLPNERRFGDNHGTQFTDGFLLYAGELSGVFALPFSTERVEMYVGGGAGMYSGTRRHSIAGVASRTIAHAPAFGILTIVGVEYRPVNELGLSLEWRFRDPVVTTENVFDTDHVVVNDVFYPLRTTPFLSRINLNGNVFRLSLRWVP